VSEDCPTVRLELQSSPETLTLVRSAIGGVAELIALDPELLDDMKTGVSEACNNVVLHAYPGSSGPLCVRVYIEPTAIDVLVRDEGIGLPNAASSDDRIQGVGLPVIQALAQQSEFRAPPDGGTEVWMRFEGERDGKPLFARTGKAAADDGWTERLSGDAVASVSPVSFAGGLLGRLARALAARARFTLDRFSDVYLITDAVAAHANQAASGPRIGFGIAADTRRMDLTIGPFRPGASSRLREEKPADDVASALLLLSDELDLRRDDGGEMLHLVMTDREWRPALTLR